MVSEDTGIDYIKYIKAAYILLMLMFTSGFVAVALGYQGALEFIMVFMFTLIGLVIMMVVDKRLN